MKKRILIHTLIFSPDGVSTAYLYNDIALKLKEMGYDVVVLTTTPHFNIVPEQVERQPMRWKVWGLCKVSDFLGIKVLHVPQKKFKSTALRLLGFLYWHIVSFFLGLTIRHVDLILSPSPPLTIGYLNLMLARLKGCKVVYNVQEIYPDILQLKDGLVLRALKGLERRVYNGSDAVTTIDQVFYDTIVGRFEDKTKLHIIPNFVDTELYHEVSGVEVNSLGRLDSLGSLEVNSLGSLDRLGSLEVNRLGGLEVNSLDRLGRLEVNRLGRLLDSDLFPKTESIKLLYAGNIGHAQSWEPLIALAERTREMDVEYFVIGEGARRDYVAGEIERLKLEKVHLLEYQPRELMPAILSYSDASFIFMDPASDGNGFPSKVYTIMACQRPMLILSGENTPIVNFLKGKGCAKLITNKNFDEKVGEMVDWLAHTTREELREMGRKGLDVIEKGYTKERVTRMYGELVSRLVG